MLRQPLSAFFGSRGRARRLAVACVVEDAVRCRCVRLRRGRLGLSGGRRCRWCGSFRGHTLHLSSYVKCCIDPLKSPPSVGSIGDSYDNAMAESVIGLFKTEVIRREGPWRGLDDVEYATLDWVSWYNEHRLLEPIGYIPPVEFEQVYYRNEATPVTVAGVN